MFFWYAFWRSTYIAEKVFGQIYGGNISYKVWAKLDQSFKNFIAFIIFLGNSIQNLKENMVASYNVS